MPRLEYLTLVGPIPGQPPNSSAEAPKIADKLPNLMPRVTASVRLMPRTAHRAALHFVTVTGGRDAKRSKTHAHT